MRVILDVGTGKFRSPLLMDFPIGDDRDIAIRQVPELAIPSDAGASCDSSFQSAAK